MEIPEAWIPTIEQHNRRPVCQRTAEQIGQLRRQLPPPPPPWDSEDGDPPITAGHRDNTW